MASLELVKRQSDMGCIGMGYEHGWILARISRMLTGQAGKQQSGATRAGSLPGLKWREKGEKKRRETRGEREREGGREKGHLQAWGG